MRLFAILYVPLSLGLASCAPTIDHGPVSLKVLARMDRQVLTKAEFSRRMQKPALLPPGNVTLPLRMMSGVPVIEARLKDGKPLPMMLDSGASRSMIQATTAADRQIPVLRAEDATVQLQGVMGKEQSRMGLLDPLILGKWTLNGYPCFVRTYENRLKGLRGADSFPETLLGFDAALEHCSFLTVDYRASQVTWGFRRPFVPSASGHATSAPFEIEKSVPFITLQSGQQTWKAIVDTGSFNGIEISEEVARRLGVQDEGEVVQGLYLMAVGGTMTSAQANLRTVKLRDLTVLRETYREVEVDIAPGPPRVGSGFLKDYRVTFDFQRKKLWLEW